MNIDYDANVGFDFQHLRDAGPNGREALEIEAQEIFKIIAIEEVMKVIDPNQWRGLHGRLRQIIDDLGQGASDDGVARRFLEERIEGRLFIMRDARHMACYSTAEGWAKHRAFTLYRDSDRRQPWTLSDAANVYRESHDPAMTEEVHGLLSSIELTGVVRWWLR